MLIHPSLAYALSHCPSLETPVVTLGRGMSQGRAINAFMALHAQLGVPHRVKSGLYRVWAGGYWHEQGRHGWHNNNWGNIMLHHECVPFHRLFTHSHQWRAFKTYPDAETGIRAMTRMWLGHVSRLTPAAQVDFMRAVRDPSYYPAVYARDARRFWTTGRVPAPVSHRTVLGFTERQSGRVRINRQPLVSAIGTIAHEAFHAGAAFAGASEELPGEERAAERFAQAAERALRQGGVGHGIEV